MLSCLQNNSIFKSVFGDGEMGASTSVEQTGLLELLRKQNADTSNAIIEHFKEDEKFLQFSKAEADGIIKRDAEDDEKLAAGIQIALEKGVISKDYVPEEYINVDVMGKTADQVADEIISKCGDTSAGLVIVLCGLSGTGKGTTVAKLSEKLPKVTTWSNGNVFRSLTYLAATWCEQNGCEGFDAEKALTPENLANFVKMLEFGKYNGKFDTKIEGLGLKMMVSEVQNTELKGAKVSKNIPTVAKVTQGEVINFAASAVKIMGEAGEIVLLEGREQTVNYVRTPFRFTLTMSDPTLIGMRRAAQRMGAESVKEFADDAPPTSPRVSDAQDAKVIESLKAALAKLSSE